VGTFLRERHLSRKGRWRFQATGANGQPAFAYYLEDVPGWRRYGIFVVTAPPEPSGASRSTRSHREPTEKPG
jgi:hypothetical protein